MSVFDYRLNRREQLVRKGEPIDNSVDFLILSDTVLIVVA